MYIRTYFTAMKVSLKILRAQYVCKQIVYVLGLRCWGLEEIRQMYHGYSSKGGAVGGGVQWMGVVSYNDTAYNIM